MILNDREKKKRLKRLKRKIKRIKWFPSYQSIDELGIRGRRNEYKRYSFLDFTLCKGKIVADYGCNLGQACIKAAKAGAKRVIGIDSQKDTIEAANDIKDILGLENVNYCIIDFNEEDFRKQIMDIFQNSTPDISFFLSVYRTKELNDRDGLFQFIIDNTKEIIFFEGHSKRSVDTVEYYTDIFYNFHLNAQFLGYSQNDTRPFFLIRLSK